MKVDLKFSQTFYDFFLEHLGDYDAETDEEMTTKSDGTKVGPRDQHFHKLLSELAANLIPLTIISEEREHVWPPPQNDFWIIDPFDGTNNANMGLPLIGSMITLVQDSQPELSAIFLPSEERETKNGFCVAIKNQGAWRWHAGTQKRLSVSSISDLNKTSLLLEGSSKKLFEYSRVRNLVKATARTRIDLSCAWAFTRLAIGKDVLVMSLDNKPTDNLHGILFAKEAGGRVIDMNGNPPSLENCANLIFSNGLVHDAALKALKGG